MLYVFIWAALTLLLKVETVVLVRHKRLDEIVAEIEENERCRIRLGACDVTNRYDKEKEREYVNFALFGFKLPGEDEDESDGEKKTGSKKSTKKQPPKSGGKKKSAPPPLKDEDAEEEDEEVLCFCYGRSYDYFLLGTL